MDSIPPIVEAILHGHLWAGLGRTTQPDERESESTQCEHGPTSFGYKDTHTVYPKGTL